MITVDRENSKLIINKKTFPLVYALCCPVTNKPVFVIVKANPKSLQSFVEDNVEFKAHHENIAGIVFHTSGSMYLNSSEQNDDEDWVNSQQAVEKLSSC